MADKPKDAAKEPTHDDPKSGTPEGPPDDPLDETPPKPAEGVEKNPAADSNPTSSGTNTMRTEGLSPAERARVEGTVMDGANGAHVRGVPADKEEPLEHRTAREEREKSLKARRAAPAKAAKK